LSVAESAPSVLPWKLFDAARMLSRPVVERQSLMAASTASAPLLPKVTYFMPGGAAARSRFASSPAASRYEGWTKLGSELSRTA
jgi:hypothetical protein